MSELRKPFPQKNWKKFRRKNRKSKLKYRSMKLTENAGKDNFMSFSPVKKLLGRESVEMMGGKQIE